MAHRSACCDDGEHALECMVQISWVQALFIAVAAYMGVSVWAAGVGYFTLYRPLIGGTIVGLIMGDVRQGMAFGAALNAVHLGFVSTGGALPSDLVTAGYIGTALALASGMDVGAALAAFGIPLGALGGLLWFGRMTLGSFIVHWADARAERGDVRGVAAINLWAGQGLLFAFYALPTFVIVYYGQWGIERVLNWIPDRLLSALSVVGGMLPAVGLGLLLRSIGRGRSIPYFIVGFVLATYFDLPLLVIGLLGLAAAWLRVGSSAPFARTGTGLMPPSAVSTPEGREKAQSVPRQAATSRRVPRRVLWGAWWRWLFFLHASYNYERLQGLGFAHAMKPVIEYLYATVEERAAALRRHLVLFNSEPQVGALVPAVVIAMEEERASGESISDEAINSVKSGLMGPLAGVGDSLFQGLITPLLLSLGISLAQQGSLSGPILYSLAISVTIVVANRFFWMLGYRWGKRAVSRILSSGWLQAISDAASVVGMVVLGGLTASLVQFSFSASISVGRAVVSLQEDVLDAILRGLNPLALTLLVWWMLARRISPMRVIGMLFVAGIDLTYLGLTGGTAPPLFSGEWASFVVGGTTAAASRAAWASTVVHFGPPLLATGGAVIALLSRRLVASHQQA